MNAEAIHLYALVREREGRLLADDVVRDLPASGNRTAHADEWAVRTRSMQRVLKHFALAARPLRVLDVGCGNGWFAARLAEAGHKVTAIDTHAAELEQAERVFEGHAIHWIATDPFTMPAPYELFDRVLLAASLQYFHDAPALLGHLSKWLAPDGEIHVVDSVLYPDHAAASAAAERSLAHYASIHALEMSGFYHHHVLSELLAIGEGHVLHKPGRFFRILPPRLVNDPFHHTAHHFPAGS